jgi:hypothetical protein
VQCTYSGTGVGAEINCTTSFLEAFNTITWTATNGLPDYATGGAKHFQTFRAAPGDVLVQATVCYNSVCTVSNVATAGGPVQYSPALVIEGPLCGTEEWFSVNVFFSSWNGTQPFPTGDMSFTGAEPAFAVIQADFYTEVPFAYAMTYFEGQSEITITAYYPGDANWLPGSASIVIPACD